MNKDIKHFSALAMQSLISLRDYNNQPIYEIDYYEVSPEYEFTRFNSQKEADEFRQKQIDKLANTAILIATSILEKLKQLN